MWGKGIVKGGGVAVTALCLGLGGTASADGYDDGTDALMRKLESMEAEMAALKAELDALRTGEAAQNDAVRVVESRVAKVESDTAPLKDKLSAMAAAMPQSGGNTIFFRGGYTGLTDDRGGGVFTDVWDITGNAANNADSGWYVGAGFDFLLTRDSWGLLPGTWALAELGVEFTHIDSVQTVLAGPTLAAGTPILGQNNMNMLTVSAAPKLKFMEGSKFRPWIIPIGLDFRVISPPSDSANYLDVGGQTAIGADYELIPGIKLGADFRYHFAADFTNPDYDAATLAALRGAGLTVNEPSNDYWTAGAYLGIGF